jgi:hypothetical protein
MTALSSLKKAKKDYLSGKIGATDFTLKFTKYMIMIIFWSRFNKRIILSAFKAVYH